MGPFVLAWLAGEGMLTYRWVKNGAPPPPGALALSSVLFIGLAVVAEYSPARPVATAFAWAVDLAVLLQLMPGSAPVKTGWPPPLITDDTVLLPSAAKG